MRIKLSIIIIAILISIPALSQDDLAKKKAFDLYFIHQSTGDNWLREGGLRAAIGNAVTNDGHKFRLTDDWSGNSDHREWPGRFEYENDWKKYDIVMFKSCFPASHIDSNSMYKEYKRTYRKQLLKLFQDHEDILFIIVTAPPLVPNETDSTCAARARKFNNWLKEKFIRKYQKKTDGMKNVAVYDFFNTLAYEDGNEANMLKKEYRMDNWDSHPNPKGGKQATEDFIPVLQDVTDTWADWLKSVN